MITPKEDENSQDFIDRFINTKKMIKKYPDRDERFERALKIWRKVKILKNE